jgi:hypothetical protein
MQVQLFSGVMFSNKPVQDEERIFGGRCVALCVRCVA